jgi:multidrug efflux pump subunit AcrB
MEERVTTYSQYAISTSVSGVKNMEAQTLNGISVIKIFFQPDVNLDLAISQIVGDELYTGTSTRRNPSANSGELQRF